MKITNITFIAITFIILILFYANTETTPQETNNNLKTIEIELQKLPQTFEYTNIYENKPTPTNVINNMIHGFVYALVIEYNTIIPTITHLAYNKDTLTEWLKAIATLIIISTILTSIIPISIIYFHIKERKQYKEKITD